MFCSNQILVINGEFDKSLRKAIKFVTKFDDKSISDITGIKAVNGKLYFGWIPKERIDGETTTEYNQEYAAKWDTTLTDPLMPTTSKLLSGIIFNWLRSDEVSDIYDKLYDEKEVGYWDTPSKGWKLTAVPDESEDDKHLSEIIHDAPTFAIFCIEPAWLEYLD